MNILNFEKRISDLTQKVKELEEDLKNSQDNCSELELCKSELESCVVPNDVFRRTDAKRLKAEIEVARLEKELSISNESLTAVYMGGQQSRGDEVVRFGKENEKLKAILIDLRENTFLPCKQASQIDLIMEKQNEQ